MTGSDNLAVHDDIAIPPTEATPTRTTDAAANNPGQLGVIRRNGKVTNFDGDKIAVAMTKAFLAVEGGNAAASSRIHEKVAELTRQVVNALQRRNPTGGTVHTITALANTSTPAVVLIPVRISATSSQKPNGPPLPTKITPGAAATITAATSSSTATSSRASSHETGTGPSAREPPASSTAQPIEATSWGTASRERSSMGPGTIPNPSVSAKATVIARAAVRATGTGAVSPSGGAPRYIDSTMRR